MKKLSFLVITILLTSFVALADISSVYTYKMQHTLDSLCKKYKIKGVSAAIFIPGEGIWKGTYGESEAGVPLTTDMLLPIGSNTKTFTSAIILKLQENGSLTVNDTVGRWIQNQPNINGQITIKQLLNHTSGLYDYTQHPNFFAALNSDFNKIWQPEDMYQFIDAPYAAPGGHWEYCNTNYLLLGIIIKQITGQPLYQAYRNLIFSPQQLSHSFFYPDEQPNGTVPHGWSADLGNQLEDMQTTYNWSNIAFLSMANAAGAIVSTAEDNVMFWYNLMNEKIINNNSLVQMKDFVYLSANTGYGFGLFRLKRVNGRVVYSHGGTCFGYLNENLVDSTSGVCITVLTNQDSLDNDFMFNRIVTALHKITTQMPPTGINESVTKDVQVSIYPNPANDVITVETNEKGATLELYDMAGRICTKTELKDGINRVALQSLVTNTYIVRISKNGLPLKTQKLMVSH